MNTSTKLIAIAVIGVLILAGLPTMQSEETEEYYEVTRYNMRGLTYDKEIIKVSMEDAEEIQKAFEGIDASLSEDKIERKRDVLVEYGLIENERSGLFSSMNQFVNNDVHRKSNHRDYGESFNLLIANIKGTLGPSYINLFHFIFFAPVFLSLARGVDIQLTSLFDSYHFQTENMVSIFAVIMVGTILVLPLISPNGYINADVILGSITELE